METEKKWTGKRVVGIVFLCILIYLLLSNSGILMESLRWLGNLFCPLLLGIVFAMILNVPMTAIERRLFPHGERGYQGKLRRPLAIGITFLLVITVVAGLMLLVVPELMEAMGLLTDLLAEYMDGVEGSLERDELPFGEVFAAFSLDMGEVQENVGIWVRERSGSMVDQVVEGLQGAAGGVVDFAFGVVFAVYILAGKEVLKQQLGWLLSVWLSYDVARDISHGLFVCFRTFRNFIIGQSVEAVILGSLCGIGMFVLGLPYAGTVGVLVGVTALIPIIGAFAGAAVGVLLILPISPVKTLVFLGFLLLLQQVEGNIIYPKVVGAKIQLPAIWVLAAVVVGGNLAGPVGMFLGVPVASSAYALLKEATRMRELQKAAEE